MTNEKWEKGMRKKYFGMWEREEDEKKNERQEIWDKGKRIKRWEEKRK